MLTVDRIDMITAITTYKKQIYVFKFTNLSKIPTIIKSCKIVIRYIININ